MKKGWKIFWIICAVIAVGGVALCCAGLAMGVTMVSISDAYRDDMPHIITSEKYTVSIQDMDDIDEIENYADEVDFDTLESYDHVTELDATVEVGQLLIQEYEGDAIKIDSSQMGNESKLKINQDGDTLEIKADRTMKFWGHTDSDTLIIYVPQKTRLDSLDIEIGAGQLIVEGLEAEEMDLKCGAGQVLYKLAGKEADYNYEVRCGAGEVRIGDTAFSGLGSQRDIDNHSAKDMSIDCGVGEVEIRFNYKK